MNKKVKGLIAGAVAVVVLVAALVVLMLMPGTEDGASSSDVSSSSDIILNNQAVSDISSITVQNGFGEYTVTPGENDDYSVTGLTEDIPLNQSGYDNITSDASEIVAKRLVEENTDNLEQYGLDEPQARVNIAYADGSEFSMEVGDEAPLEAGTYVLQDDKVYLFLSHKVDTFLLSNLAFVDKNLTGPAGDETPVLVKMTLSGTARPQTVVMEDSGNEVSGMSNYNITAPKHHEGDRTKTQELADSIYGISTQEVVAVNPTDEQLAEYGLKEPYSVVEAVFEKETITLKASEPKDGYSYVMNGARNIIYKLSAEGYPWIDATYESLASVMVITPLITTVNELVITTPEKEYTFELTSVESTDESTLVFQEATYEGQVLDTDNFKNFYQNVISARNRTYTTEQPQEGAEPILTIRYRYTDTTREDDEVEFYEAENTRVFVSLNGDCESMEYQSYVDGILGNLQSLINGETVNTIS